jgi:site-specific recombinase XerD
MINLTLGPTLHAFFENHLNLKKGLRPASVKSYRDVLRLFLQFVARDARRKISKLLLTDLTFERVQRFLRHLETDRNNHIRTRNHRLATLHTFFEYIATQVPEMIVEAERIAAIPIKRVSPPETYFLERDEINALFAKMPSDGQHSLRDRTLLLVLYNTGARVQEVAELRVANLELGSPPRVHLHGKGDKWRVCPLWTKTANLLRQLLKEQGVENAPDSPLFLSHPGRPLTRFGIYKIVRRHTQHLNDKRPNGESRHISPHVFRHTAAAHLLESGVEVNVIRAWLGHATLDTTNRYAEINIRTKEEALKACEPLVDSSEGFPRRPIWRDDQSLLKWLNSL